MILAELSDSFLRSLVRRGALPGEDIFWEEEAILDALERGFPRLLVRRPGRGLHLGEHDPVPVLELTDTTLEAWEDAWRDHEIPPRKAEYFAGRLRNEIRATARSVPWVDATFRDVTRATGASLPEGLKGMGRRVMEFPAHYRTLKPLAAATDLSVGALKERFRRRGMESPSVYLRWFRAVAVVHGLTRMGLQYREASYRFGFAGSANLCRFLEGTTGLSPADLTEGQGRERLLIRFASELLDPRALTAWEDLDRVFLRRVA